MLESNPSVLWLVIGCSIIIGLVISRYLRERPWFKCVECNAKLKYGKQHHCHNCGSYLNWNWVQKNPWLNTRYQSDEQFRKWTILIPVVKKTGD